MDDKQKSSEVFMFVTGAVIGIVFTLLIGFLVLVILAMVKDAEQPEPPKDREYRGTASIGIILTEELQPGLPIPTATFRVQW